MRLRHSWAGALLVSFGLGLASCDAQGIGCRVDSECTGGDVCVAGQCVPDRGTSDLSGGIDTDAGPRPDMAQPGAPDGYSPDALTAGCPFNQDGIIQRLEVPAMAGLGGFFHANQGGQVVPVNVKKMAGAWDFSVVGAGDEKIFDGLSSPAGTWWAGDFPNASYAQLADAENDLLGVYKIDEDKLSLLGIVSRTDGFSATKLVYAQPIEVLRFPLSTTSAWTSTSNVSGTASGIAFFASETWSMRVDDSGTAKTPAADFPVLRLRVDYQQTWGFSVTRRIIYLYLTECYGTVARVRSKNGETATDFTEASEYRRLAAP